MRKSVTWLSAAFVASSATALWLWHELRAERLHIAQLTAQLAASAANEDSDVSEAVIETTPAPAAQRPVDTDPPAARPENPKQVSAQENWHEYQRRLLANPRYLDERRAQRRLELAARREEAMRLLGFTDEEADGVINLWIESEIRSDMRQTSSTDTDLEAIRARIATEERANLESLQKLLGERKAEQWRNYFSSLGTRSRVNQLQGQLSGIDMLRDDQVEPLISAIHTEVLQMKGEARDFRDSLNWQTDQLKSHQRSQEREIELMIETQGRIRASTAAILSRAQQEKLDAMLAREIEAHRSQLRMQRVYSKIDAANAAPPN